MDRDMYNRDVYAYACFTYGTPNWMVGVPVKYLYKIEEERYRLSMTRRVAGYTVSSSLKIDEDDPYFTLHPGNTKYQMNYTPKLNLPRNFKRKKI